MISGSESSSDTITTFTGLLQQALGAEIDQVQAIVNFIQMQKSSDDRVATVRVGKDSVNIPAGKTVQV